MKKLKFAVRDFWYTITGRVTYKQAIFAKSIYNTWDMYETQNSLEEWKSETIKNIDSLHVSDRAKRLLKGVMIYFYNVQFVYVDEESDEIDFEIYDTTLPPTAFLIGRKWRKRF